MKAEIFSIGTELLMGDLMDTNAAWLAARLPALGIQLQGISISGYSDQTMLGAEKCPSAPGCNTRQRVTAPRGIRP